MRHPQEIQLAAGDGPSPRDPVRIPPQRHGGSLRRNSEQCGSADQAAAMPARPPERFSLCLCGEAFSSKGSSYAVCVARKSVSLDAKSAHFADLRQCLAGPSFIVWSCHRLGGGHQQLWTMGLRSTRCWTVRPRSTLRWAVGLSFASRCAGCRRPARCGTMLPFPPVVGPWVCSPPVVELDVVAPGYGAMRPPFHRVVGPWVCLPPVVELDVVAPATGPCVPVPPVVGPWVCPSPVVVLDVDVPPVVGPCVPVPPVVGPWVCPSPVVGPWVCPAPVVVSEVACAGGADCAGRRGDAGIGAGADFGLGCCWGGVGFVVPHATSKTESGPEFP